jgi:hypothetical protein
MARPSGEKIKAGGRWTQAKYNSFIKNQLRQATRKWPPISDVLREARTRRGWYLCAGCGEEVPATVKDGAKRTKNVHVDHEPAVIDPEKGFTTWDECVERMFCEADSLQVLCHSCHSKVTAEETELRKVTRGRQTTYPMEYKCWQNMRSRCNNPRSTGYQYYGGRGIKVCPEWNESIKAFVEDMGPRPSYNHSIERLDRDGDYCPNNCKWATHSEQARNTSKNCVVEYGEKALSVVEWGEELGIKPNTITTRLRRGWSVAEALEFVEREKPLYKGRLTDSEILYILEEVSKGKTQTALGRELGIDRSQISRVLKKIDEKSKEEAALRAKHRKESKDEQ